jgi:hypothetical protein
MNGKIDGMGAWMAAMMGSAGLIAVLALVVLVLLAIWLVQQVRRGPGPQV